jgi:hypothetical protein
VDYCRLPAMWTQPTATRHVQPCSEMMTVREQVRQRGAANQCWVNGVSPNE